MLWDETMDREVGCRVCRSTYEGIEKFERQVKNNESGGIFDVIYIVYKE